MSVLDRMHRQTVTEQSRPKTSESTALVAVDPVVARVQTVIRAIMKRAQDNGKLGRVAFVLNGIIDELVEELNDLPSEMLPEYFSYMGSLIIWMGSGDGRYLTPELRIFVTDVLGIAVSDPPDNTTNEADEETDSARSVLALSAGQDE